MTLLILLDLPTAFDTISHKYHFEKLEALHSCGSTDKRILKDLKALDESLLEFPRGLSDVDKQVWLYRIRS